MPLYGGSRHSLTTIQNAPQSVKQVIISPYSIQLLMAISLPQCYHSHAIVGQLTKPWEVGGMVGSGHERVRSLNIFLSITVC